MWLDGFDIWHYWCWECLWSRTLVVWLGLALIVVSVIWLLRLLVARVPSLLRIVIYAAFVRRTTWVNITASTNFVNNGDDNWGAAGLVVENAGDFVLNFLLSYVKVDFSTNKGAGNFLLEILADKAHELFTITEVNKPA